MCTGISDANLQVQQRKKCLCLFCLLHPQINMMTKANDCLHPSSQPTNQHRKQPRWHCWSGKDRKVQPNLSQLAPPVFSHHHSSHKEFRSVKGQIEIKLNLVFYLTPCQICVSFCIVLYLHVWWNPFLVLQHSGLLADGTIARINKEMQNELCIKSELLHNTRCGKGRGSRLAAAWGRSFITC